MKILLFFSLLIITGSLCAQKGKEFPSIWNDNPGGNTVLTDNDYHPEVKGKVLFCLSNNDSNLYIDMKITETLEQNTILKTGMTVWINTDGKSKKLNGIRFPIGTQYSRAPRPGDPGYTGIDPTPLQRANTIQLTGFEQISQKRFPSNNQDNIRGSVSYDKDGNLIYHLTVPYTRLQPLVSEGALSDAQLIIGIEYGAPPESTGQGGGAPPTGGGSSIPRGGGRAPGGGGMPSGGMPSGPSGGSAGAEKPELFWIKEIILAQKK